jgi:hypothetical protein
MTSMAQLDDATTAYVLEMRGPFELLRQAEAQLAGLLVLAATGGSAIAGHPMLDLAADAFKEAVDGVRSRKVPPPARHHHRHVERAAHGIGLAIAQARRGLRRCDDAAIGAVLAPLRAAHQHLIWAASALPGFEVVALSQACCAGHAKAS